MAEQIPEPKDERPGTVGGLSSSFPPQEFYTPFEMALSLRVGEVDNKLVRLEATQEKFATKSDIETVVKAAVAELKKDIVDVRTELKTELKKDIVDVRTELKKDIAGISTKFWAATGVFVALFIALFTS
ncbi:MAG: hypothetical protein LBR80_17055, partial [Deltaproteobacteria bacterium]|nr:hypothetical protein [Deltaproteobacteria bacterium]